MVLHGHFIIANIVSHRPVLGVLPLEGIKVPVVGMPRDVSRAEVWEVSPIGPAEEKLYILKVHHLYPQAFDEGDKKLVFGVNHVPPGHSWVIEAVDEEEHIYTIAPPGDPRAGKWTLDGVGGDQVSIQVLLMGDMISPLQQFKFQRVLEE